MANARHQRANPEFGAALDKQRLRSQQTEKDRREFEEKHFFQRLLAGIVGPAGAAAGAGIGALVGGGNPGAIAAGAGIGGAGGSALGSLATAQSDFDEEELRRREAEEAAIAMHLASSLR